jgi:hypothetical protein
MSIESTDVPHIGTPASWSCFASFSASPAELHDHAFRLRHRRSQHVRA